MVSAASAIALSGDGFGRTPVPTTEVVVTLKAPPLATFGRSLLSARHTSYLRQIESQQAVVSARIEQAIPSSRIRWRYKLVAKGLARSRTWTEEHFGARLREIIESVVGTLR